jgi:acyl-CoA thioesterase YciA
LASH